MADLNERQRKFVERYMAHGNATQAARKAGYKGDEATLATAGWRLMRNAEVRAAIEARLGMVVGSGT